jgi:hypothetical protein
MEPIRFSFNFKNLILIIFILFINLYSEQKLAICIKTSPYFELPQTNLLPKGFIEKYDTCIIDSVYIDSLENAWFKILCKSKAGWISVKALNYIDNISQNYISNEKQNLNEKKKRAEIVKAHPEWPFRIKKAVREGKICLDMTKEQLFASWGEPMEIKKAYMLGVGEYDIYLYKDLVERILIVSLKQDRVTGWVLGDK